jgi:anti-anti-sigma factor
MLRVTVQKLGDSAILHCHGRIVRGQETSILCAAVRQNGRNVLLDLRKVDGIDAGGLGALVSLRTAGFCLKLKEPAAHVRRILSLTKLDSIFEICESESADEMLGRVEVERSGAIFHPAVGAIEIPQRGTA